VATPSRGVCRAVGLTFWFSRKLVASCLVRNATKRSCLQLAGCPDWLLALVAEFVEIGKRS
jgi:hypothetical protein